MGKILTLIIGTFLAVSASAQQNPVHLTYKAEKTGDKTYTIHITAQIDEGWHIYSQNQPKEAIAQPTKIAFFQSPLFALKGKLSEDGKKEKYEDKLADIIQYQYGGTVEFAQTITMRAPVKTTLKGNITYQACTDERCLTPQTEPFTVSIE
ncbi:MAG: hypothetical protein JST68_21475 [Bacteroidetes bacterium]|nr:hypothetical protein [Bacteroidota bacterium]